MTWRGGSAKTGPMPGPITTRSLQWIALGPELAGHGLIDDDYAGSGSVVAVGEIAAAEDGDLEDIEIAPGDGEVSGASGVGIVAVGAAHDVEGQAEASLQRETAGGRGGGDSGNGVDALGAVVDHLGDAAGLLKVVATDRHGHGEDVVCVKSGINGLQLHERAN